MSTTTKNPCDKNNSLLLDCKRELDTRKTLKGGTAVSSIILKQEKIINRDNKICCFLKAEQSHTLYRNLNIYLGIDANCKADEIKSKVTDLSVSSKELGKKMVEVTKCLKTIKEKAAELKNKVCDIDTAIKDSCNKTQLQILNSHFTQEDCFDSKGLFGGIELSNMEDIVSCMVDQTKDIWKKADNAFKSSVSIAGIQTFSDVTALKERSMMVIKCLGDFKKDLDSNVSSTETNIKEAQKEMITCIKEVALNTMNEHLATSTFEGTAATLDFACDPCNPASEMTIEDICDKVMNNACEPKESKKISAYAP